MRVEVCRTLDHPVEKVWQAVSDPTGYCAFVPGCHAVDPVHGGGGRGARYAYRVDAGSAPLGGTLELVRYEPRRELAWRTVTGPRCRGRWRMRELGDARTRVTLRVSYPATAGALGFVTDRMLAMVVRGRAEETLRRLGKNLGEELAGTRHPEPVPQPGARERAGTVLQGAYALARSGLLLPPARPDRAGRQLATLARWGLKPAGGYAAAAAAVPDRLALIDERGTLTFAELDERSTRLAWSFASYGVGTRARAALLGRNHRGMVESVVACAKLGADPVLLDTALDAARLSTILDAHGIDLVVADAEFRPLFEQAPGRVRLLTAWSDGPLRGATLEGLIAEGPARPVTPPERPGRTTVLTRGETGPPTGVRQPARGIASLAAILSRLPLRAGGRFLLAAPLVHTWGYDAVQLAMALRSTVVLQRRFDPEAALRAIGEHGCAALFAVPGMLARILELPEATRRGIDTSALRVVVSRGPALSGELVERFRDSFGDVLYTVYGTAELAWATIATPTDLLAAPGTVGRPPRGTAVAILGEDGEQLPRGATGEIHVRHIDVGHEVPSEGDTAASGGASRKGLVPTGDTGHFDASGLLFVDGRAGDPAVRRRGGGGQAAPTRR